jgi:hypothetical protein
VTHSHSDRSGESDRWDEALAELLAQEAADDAAAPHPNRGDGTPPLTVNDGPVSPVRNDGPVSPTDGINDQSPTIDRSSAGNRGNDASYSADADRLFDIGHDGLNTREVALLLLDRYSKRLMAALMKAVGVDAHTFESEGLAIAVLADPTEDAALKAAEAVSKALKSQIVCLFHRGPSINPAATDLQGNAFLDGRAMQLRAPGLFLAQAPELLEDLLVEPPTVDELVRAEWLDSRTIPLGEANATLERYGRRRPTAGGWMALLGPISGLGEGRP